MLFRSDADGLSERDADADGERDADGLKDADGLVDGDGLCDAEFADTCPPIATSTSSPHGQRKVHPCSVA